MMRLSPWMLHSCWVLFPIALALSFELLGLLWMVGILVGLFLAALQRTPLSRNAGVLASLRFQTLWVQIAVSLSLIQQILSSVNGKVTLQLPLIGLLTALSLAMYALYVHQKPNHNPTPYRLIRSLLGSPPLTISLLMSISITAFVLTLVHWSAQIWPAFAWAPEKFLERGLIPPLTLGLFFWGLMLLLNKSQLILSEMRRFRNDEHTIRSELLTCLMEANNEREAPEMLETMWKASAESYTVVRYLCWAIPILGFIGTVLGISLAASGIQELIGSAGGLSQFNSELGAAIAPLGIAFDTTLVALSLSLPLVWFMTLVQNREGDMLNTIEQWLNNPQNV